MTSYRDVSGAQDRDVREPGRNAGGCGGWWAAGWGRGGDPKSGHTQTTCGLESAGSVNACVWVRAWVNVSVGVYRIVMAYELNGTLNRGQQSWLDT